MTILRGVQFDDVLQCENISQEDLAEQDEHSSSSFNIFRGRNDDPKQETVVGKTRPMFIKMWAHECLPAGVPKLVST